MTAVQRQTLAPFDPQSVRDDFPILHTAMHGKPLVYLDSAASAQKPQCVIDSLAHTYQARYANVHRGAYQLADDTTAAFENARHTIASFLHASHPHEIIFTRGTTESINMLAHMLVYNRLFDKRRAIVTSELEHHSNFVPWLMLRDRFDIDLRIAPVSPNGDLSLDTLDSLIDENVALVAITHVSNVLGTILPIDAIAERAHKHGALLFADGSQAAPNIDVDVQALDVDFYAATGHKLYGPNGIGILYGKTHLLESFSPPFGGGEMIASVSKDGYTLAELPWRYEPGTPPIAEAIALGCAIDYMRSHDQNAIRHHKKRLLERATHELQKRHNIRLLGTPDLSDKTSVVSFSVDDVHPHDLATLLDQQGVAVRAGNHCAEPLMHALGIQGTIRASLGMYSTDSDIDRFITALDKALAVLC